MYSKEELLIFSFINSNYDISIQNLTYKIFNFSNKENINFFKLNRIEKIEFLKSFFSEDNIEKILFVFDKLNLYKIEIEKKAKKKLLKMDKKNQFLILDYLKNTLSELENPRSQGKALQGKYKGKWRYRVGNYRILATIIDEKITIYIFDIGHRKEIYKKMGYSCKNGVNRADDEGIVRMEKFRKDKER